MTFAPEPRARVRAAPMSRALIALALALIAAAPARAQAPVYAELIAVGFSAPVAFVQNPADPAVQVIVEQAGRVRVLQHGVVQPTDFLNLTGMVRNEGEQGLLGLAFAPDFGSSGRVYVNFVNQQGHTVIARFTRASTSPLVADPASRFDLRWPDGNRFISQPFANHKGGTIAFGEDGYLYIGMGDGGAGNDPLNKAQDPQSLLGKMLRLDVSVPAGDPNGYVVPGDNPVFPQGPTLREIWSMGLRNPWKWSFDRAALGGTGALLIADVGQGAWEEINYEPAGAGGRNYGWRVREGLHDNITSPPPFSPMTDPILEYARGSGSAVTGGFVYRGSALGSFYRGRYFYADFVQGRIWSVGLVIPPGQSQATAGSIIEHTSSVGPPSEFISSFGQDASGEVYLLSYVLGRVYRLAANPGHDLFVEIDQPAPGVVSLPFTVSGWAIDRAATSGTGVDAVHVYAVPPTGPAIFLGQSYGLTRDDVASSFGSRFRQSGFVLNITSLPRGVYTIVAYARSVVTGGFDLADTVPIELPAPVVIAIEAPAPMASFPGKLTLSGFAVDTAAQTGTGVDYVHVWGTRAGGETRFIGAATYGLDRPDLIPIYGAGFRFSGWSIVAADLPEGTWTFTVYLHSTVTGTFRTSAQVPVQVTFGVRMFVDEPGAGSEFPGRRVMRVAGWALDLGAGADVGIGVIHVWAVPSSGAAPTFLGAAIPTLLRPDVAAIYGAQYQRPGFELPIKLVPGTYTLFVYVQRLSTGTFDLMLPVAVVVR